jgi:uncharacterized protein YbjT (DUF2867 family)
MKILVTGATGYVGSQLVPELVRPGHEVSCMVRDQTAARNRSALAGTRLIQADALNAASLQSALAGIDVAYYLIHSMDSGKSEFAARDREAAGNFASPPGDWESSASFIWAASSLQHQAVGPPEIPRRNRCHSAGVRAGRHGISRRNYCR